MEEKAALEEALAPLKRAPAEVAVLCDIDGTLAPIAARPGDAKIFEEAKGALEQLSGQYGVVACVSGRPALEARKIVAVDGITYIGNHGYELLPPAASDVDLTEDAGTYRKKVHSFGATWAWKLLQLGIRAEDKGPIFALHWRGVEDEAEAMEGIKKAAAAAKDQGLKTHWGRKVLELRPPQEVNKGNAIATLLKGKPLNAALYIGDDVTDLDAFSALRELKEEGKLETTVCIGVKSDEGPSEVAEQADITIDGVEGAARLLQILAALPK